MNNPQNPSFISDDMDEDNEECAICSNDFGKLFPLQCGHSFCEDCIRRLNLKCPMCRAPFKLQSVEVESQPVGRAFQLLSIKDKTLSVNKPLLKRCLQDPNVKDLPVCFISVIGEKRHGKSTLMSIIVRALEIKEKGQEITLGDPNTSLTEFDCGPGRETITKGIWMYNRHFILEGAQKKKVAVFVLDTEGSLSNETKETTSVLLSALANMLSSYQIINVNSNLKSSDFQQLLMLRKVPKPIEEHLNMTPAKIRFLVRDWTNSTEYGSDFGEINLEEELQKYSSSHSDEENSKLKKTLEDSRAKCCLLPFPGKGAIGKTLLLKDADEDFKEHLKKYIEDLVDDILKYSPANHTCTQFMKVVNDFFDVTQMLLDGFDIEMAIKKVFTERKEKIEETVKVQQCFHNVITDTCPKLNFTSADPRKVIGNTYDNYEWSYEFEKSMADPVQKEEMSSKIKQFEAEGAERCLENPSETCVLGKFKTGVVFVMNSVKKFAKNAVKSVIKIGTLIWNNISFIVAVAVGAAVGTVLGGPAGAAVGVALAGMAVTKVTQKPQGSSAMGGAVTGAVVGAAAGGPIGAAAGAAVGALLGIWVDD